eukprot:scaffold63498_cov18-Tisochrysis_lutea.AAC.1
MKAAPSLQLSLALAQPLQYACVEAPRPTCRSVAKFGCQVVAFCGGVCMLRASRPPTPLTAPYADLSAEEIEAAVAVREPIASGDLSQPLKLFGEDAILDWPGALDVVIRERDAYMARTVAAAASDPFIKRLLAYQTDQHGKV